MSIAQNGDLVQGCITPTKCATYYKFKFGFLQIVRFVSNLGFAVHVQYGITNTCLRHAHYGGVCRLKFRKGSSFVRFAPSEGKENSRNFAKMPTFRKSGRDPLLKNLHPPQTKILIGMGLVEASQINRLRKQGGLRELSPPQYFEWGGGIGVSFSSPPKNPISLKNLD